MYAFKVGNRLFTTMSLNSCHKSPYKDVCSVQMTKYSTNVGAYMQQPIISH